MKIFKQNVAARAVKMLSLGVLSVWLLSCEKGAVAPAEEAKPLSDGRTDMQPREFGESDLYFLRFIDIDRLSKISGADGDMPKLSDVGDLPEKNYNIGHWDLLAIDKAKDQLYYFTGKKPAKLMRVNIDGTNFTELVIFPLYAPFPRNLKCDGKNLYWIEPIKLGFSGQIVKADLNGSNRKVIYKGDPFAMTLDTVNGKIYFYDKLYNAVCTVDPNGFGLKIVIKNAHIYDAGGLVVDPAVKKFYWISSFNDIRSANLDGTNYKILLQANTFINSTHSARQIILDKSGNYLFYKFHGKGEANTPFYRIRIDGSEQPKLLWQGSPAFIVGMVLR